MKPLSLKYPLSVHPNMVLIILMVSLLLIPTSLGFIVWQIYKVRSRVKGFKPMAKLLLGDELQHPKFDENTARQILSLLCSPIETVTQNITQPQPTNSTQPKPVMRVPTSLVTMRSPVPLKSVPPLPLARGLTLLTKRVIPAQSTEQLTEALKEVMIELDTPDPTIMKYKKYLQKQTIEPSDVVQRCSMAEPPQPTLIFKRAEKPKNLIVINYECPPNPNHINHILESLIHITGLYV